MLLEPIGTLHVYVPNDDTGDIMGDINKRRGRIIGMNPSDEPEMTCVSAEVPMAEMADYASMLRSSTQGCGYFTLDFARYEEAPMNIANKVREEYQPEDE